VTKEEEKELERVREGDSESMLAIVASRNRWSNVHVSETIVDNLDPEHCGHTPLSVKKERDSKTLGQTERSHVGVVLLA
jgi:hypothetical protein